MGYRIIYKYPVSPIMIVSAYMFVSVTWIFPISVNDMSKPSCEYTHCGDLLGIVPPQATYAGPYPAMTS